MNVVIHEPGDLSSWPTPQRLIDRLVDGGLDQGAREALLLQLDAEPDGQGWRRCALAFLEAQAWQVALGALATPNRAKTPTIEILASSQGPQPRVVDGPHIRRWLVRAAGLLLAFTLGWASHRPWSPPEPPGSMIGVPPTLADAPEDAASPATKLPDDPIRVVDEPAAPTPSLVSLRSPQIAPSSPIPDYMRGQLERQGYRIEQSPGLAAVALKDGRRVAVPVERVRVRYVGHPTY